MKCDFCGHGYRIMEFVKSKSACVKCVEIDTNAYGECDVCKRKFRELDNGGIGLSNGMTVCTTCHDT